MGGVWTVFRKEFLENLRDRRTLTTALLLGPVFGPILLALLLQFIANREDVEGAKPIELAVIHAERAPNLLEYLTANGADLEPVKYNDSVAQRAVIERRHRVILSIPSDFGTRLADNAPAPLLLYFDGANLNDSRSVRRVAALLTQYGQTIAQQRMVARGVDPTIAVPIAVQSIDVATPRNRAETTLSMLSYIVMFAMLVGGMYLAIDATAGERERGTLESLLTTPVPREHIVFGKILATCAYMAISLTLTLTTIAIAISQIRLEGIGIAIDLRAPQVLQMIATTLPFIPLGAALMTLIASFTKSYREAQSWLSGALLVPTFPLAIASILNLKPSLATMAVPSLSQHFQLMAAVRGETLPVTWMLLSAGVSLGLAALVITLVGHRYRREAILG
jgi:sodium transport system permease protein